MSDPTLQAELRVLLARVDRVTDDAAYTREETRHALMLSQAIVDRLHRGNDACHRRHAWAAFPE